MDWRSSAIECCCIALVKEAASYDSDFPLRTEDLNIVCDWHGDKCASTVIFFLKNLFLVAEYFYYDSVRLGCCSGD